MCLSPAIWRGIFCILLLQTSNMAMYSLYYRLSFFVIGVLAIASCTKKKTNTNTPSPSSSTASFHLSYNGNTWAYQPINFTSDLPDSVKRFWNFGDGTSTIDSIHPTHIYAHDGSYTVTLTALGQTITKKIPISIGLEKLTNHKNWHRHSYLQEYDTINHTYITPTQIQDTDVQFTISYTADKLHCFHLLYPYYIVIPGGYSIYNHTFSSLTLSIESKSSSEILFNAFSSDPAYNFCIYYINDDSVRIKMQENSIGKPVRLYTVTYSSY